MNLNIVLVEPEIPQNTGSIGRLCLATQSALHLIEPLGFEISDRTLKRAGLDYWKFVDLHRHPTLNAFLEGIPKESSSLFFFSKKAKSSFFERSPQLIQKPKNLFLIFGKETAGLPDWVLEKYQENLVKLPMSGPKVRSLNLSQSVAIGVYESLRASQCF